ncbi:MAG: hypothetical protein ACLFV4_05575 [Candidatus Hydrogenedentota bacterium]
MDTDRHGLIGSGCENPEDGVDALWIAEAQHDSAHVFMMFV